MNKTRKFSSLQYATGQRFSCLVETSYCRKTAKSSGMKLDKRCSAKNQQNNYALPTRTSQIFVYRQIPVRKQLLCSSNLQKPVMYTRELGGSVHFIDRLHWVYRYASKIEAEQRWCTKSYMAPTPVHQFLSWKIAEFKTIDYTLKLCCLTYIMW